MRSPPTVMLPSVGESRPPIRLSSVVLPEPDGPMSARKSPLRDVEVDVMQHLDLLLAALVDLADVADLDQCAHASLAYGLRTLVRANADRRAVVQLRAAAPRTTLRAGGDSPSTRRSSP